MTHPESLRLAILRTLKARFEAVVPDVGDDPFPFGFSIVKIGPMPDQVATKRNAIGLVVGNETKDSDFQQAEAALPLTVEWRFTVNTNDDVRFGSGEPGVAAEIMLLAVQRVMSNPRGIEGLTLDIRETGNTIDLDTYADKAIVGTVHYEVQYRHDADDPRTWQGEAPGAP